MFVVIPLVFLGFSCMAARRYMENWRSSLLLAAVIAGGALTAITEFLSTIQAFSFYPLLGLWLLLAFAAAWKAFSFTGSLPARPVVNFKAWPLSDAVLLGIIVLLGLASGVTASFGVPNTWDSMTYHLPRVEHWIQNRSIGFYPTNITRQLFSPPWAEYAIANVRILGGGITSSNFIQWGAMAGSLLAVSLIAWRLGANRTGQLLACALAACLPMGILQSVTTQTDYVCAFWLAVFVFFILEARRQFQWTNILAGAVSLGLALLTKGTGYIFALPFLAWFITADFKNCITRSVPGLLVIVLCAVGLNTGQYLRNIQTFRSPAWTNISLTNQKIELKILEENIIRNVSINLATPLMGVNENMAQAIAGAARFLGADLNDQRSSLGGAFKIQSMVFDEDYAGNLLHALLFAVVLVVSWLNRSIRGKTGFYSACLVASFLLFCLIVRFQPWNSRFHLPLFILFCPVAGLVVEYLLKQRSVVLAMVFFVCALPWVCINSHHPWIGPMNIFQQPKPAQFFYRRIELALPYAATTGYIKALGCKQIGLLISEESWEYPWWGLLAGKGVRIEHVGVDNPSALLKYPGGNFQACAIIVSGVQVPPLIMEGSGIYGQVSAIPAGDAKVSVFLRRF